MTREQMLRLLEEFKAKGHTVRQVPLGASNRPAKHRFVPYPWWASEDNPNRVKGEQMKNMKKAGRG